MKHLLLTTIAAVLVVGCGPSVDIWTGAQTGNIEVVKQHLADGVDVNSKSDIGRTSLDVAIAFKQPLITDLLRKHGGKTRDELKAAESIVVAVAVVVIAGRGEVAVLVVLLAAVVVEHGASGEASWMNCGGRVGSDNGCPGC